MIERSLGKNMLPPPVTEDEAIVSLVVHTFSLQRASLTLAKENETQAVRIKELEQQLESSVPKEYFSSLVERMIKKGDIPVPKEILQFNLPVDILCEPTDVYVQHDGVFVEVGFHSNGYSCSARFKFVPTPTWEGVYPDFHMGYEKQKPAVKRKPRTRKKKLDSAPLVAP